jgi:RNA polymerase sigma factor for flagellar operon FliA
MQSSLSSAIASWMPMVHHEVTVVHRRMPPNVSRDDLIGAATWGLLDAMRKCEQPSEQYVRARIRGAIFDELRSQDWLSRGLRRCVRAGRVGAGVTRFEDLPPELAERLDASPNPLAVQRVFELSALADALVRLPERERAVLWWHYFEGSQLQEVADLLRVTPARASQLHARAIERLRERLGQPTTRDREDREADTMSQRHAHEN